MGIKIPGKMGKYGIIRHNPSFSPATAFKADGPTNNQWTNPVLVTTDFRTIYFNALSPKIDPGSAATGGSGSGGSTNITGGSGGVSTVSTGGTPTAGSNASTAAVFDATGLS